MDSPASNASRQVLPQRVHRLRPSITGSACQGPRWRSWPFRRSPETVGLQVKSRGSGGLRLWGQQWTRVCVGSSAWLHTAPSTAATAGIPSSPPQPKGTVLRDQDGVHGPFADPEGSSICRGKGLGPRSRPLGAATDSPACDQNGLPVAREAVKKALCCRSAAEALVRRITCDDTVP